MVTPIHDDGALDLDGAPDAGQVPGRSNGNDGLVVAGTTGEAPTLTDDEQVDLCRAVREAVTMPIVAGATSNDTAHSVQLTKAISATGVDAILALTPYYNRPSQAGITAHFTRRRRRHRPAGDALRHPDPHWPQDRPRHAREPAHATSPTSWRSRTPSAILRSRRPLVARRARPRALQRRGQDDAAVARGRRVRHRQRGHALERAAAGRDVECVRQGRRRHRPGDQRAPDRVVGLRGQRTGTRIRSPPRR